MICGFKHIIVSVLVFISMILIGGSAMAFEIKSPAFVDGGSIPSKYTCDSEADLSPPLNWSQAPLGTKSFALICDDPDAPSGTWVHWVAWNIPAKATHLKEGLEKKSALADGTKQGITDFRRPGYGGPCPPSGTHRYFFKLYALGTTPELPTTTTKTELEAAMRGHILAEARIMGTYNRRK